MRARPLMVQGTMSSVGKSLLVAGLCRVLVEDGVRVCPFKSQNMALNSAVTPDGAEIGRAQALQAYAALLEPEADMNPVLLKPTTDHESQVIVSGRVRAQMPARDYFRYRASLMPEILAAFERLAQTFDVILIEGAGSPVELNLKRNDICNSGIARATRAPVALVGDIDRGGIFAQLVGTLQLMEPSERSHVRTTIVNKFRGDETLFADGRAMLEQLCGLPVAGVVPYLDLELADEDSLARALDVRAHARPIDVAVIRLPKISNFTDLDVLRAHPALGVRYVTRAHELRSPDLIVIPGTKSTMADLAWMRERGLADQVVRAAREGTPVIGICGGYQILGETIEDPLGIEGPAAATEGLGLLPVSTRLAETKRTATARGCLVAEHGPLSAACGRQVMGYEIHHGRTRVCGGSPLVALECEDGVVYEGCACENVCGCYLHGLFDADGVADSLAATLVAAKGARFDEGPAPSAHDLQERELARLAKALRESLDMDLLYSIIEEGI